MKIIFYSLILTIILFTKVSAEFTSAEKKISGQCGSVYKNIVGDFNGDRKSDIAYFKGTKFYVLFSSLSSLGVHKFDIVRQFGDIMTPESEELFYTGDFNNDGYDDIAIIKNNILYPYLFTITTNGSVSMTALPTQNIGSYTKYWVGDFNGDGKDEVFAYSLNGNKLLIYNINTFIATTCTIHSDLSTILNNSLNRIKVGDFNGDGKDELIMYHNNRWYIASMNSNNFFSLADWTNGELNSLGDNYQLLVGDFDGNGNSDICYNKNSTPTTWYVRLADINGNPPYCFNWESGWESGAAVNDYVVSGDFDGDGLSDKATYVNPACSEQGWWVSYSINHNQREVGIYFLMNDYSEGGKKHDSSMHKLYGYYKYGYPDSSWKYQFVQLKSQLDFEQQFYDIKHIGVDFVTLDLSNGFCYQGEVNFISPPVANPDKLDTLACASNKLDWAFSTANNYGLKVSFMLGLEFWGKGTMEFYHFNDPNLSYLTHWEYQKQRQDNLFNKLRDTYFLQPNYYKHLGKPLVVAYISDGIEYPMSIDNDIDNPQKHIEKKYYPDITIRYSLNLEQSFPTTKLGRTLLGMTRLGYWGFGSGPLWNTTDNTIPSMILPASKEMMFVMPGVRYYNDSTETGIIPKVQIKRYIDNNQKHGRSAYYKKSWANVLMVMPQKVLIASWNAFCEESAIMGTVDAFSNPMSYTYGWGDVYLKLTKLYTYMFKKNEFPGSGIKFRIMNDEGDVVESPMFISRGKTTYSAVCVADLAVPEDSILIIPNKWLSGKFESTKLNKNSFNMVNEYALLQNFPNPFNPITTISYQISNAGKVSLKVYDILGKEVAVLVDEYKEAGKYSVSFNGINFASGVYFYRFEAGSFVSTKKLVLIK